MTIADLPGVVEIVNKAGRAVRIPRSFPSPYVVRCPVQTCCSAPGFKCCTSTGRYMKNFHRERVSAAKAGITGVPIESEIESDGED